MKLFWVAVNLAVIIVEPRAQTQPETLVYNRCISESAQLLDDGKSDAVSVARGLMFWCQKERMASLERFIKTNPNAGPVMELQKELRESHLDQATMAVLTSRKRK